MMKRRGKAKYINKQMAIKAREENRPERTFATDDTDVVFKTR